MLEDKTSLKGDRPKETTNYTCLCAAIRKAGRVVTRRYNRFLKPSSLKITQFSLLANISRNKSITISKLAKLLMMDQTTVTRELRVLEKSGYITLDARVSDRRMKKIHLTEVGRSKLDEARPYWMKAQLEMEGELGRSDIENLLNSLQKLIN